MTRRCSKLSHTGFLPHLSNSLRTNRLTIWHYSVLATGSPINNRNPSKHTIIILFLNLSATTEIQDSSETDADNGRDTDYTTLHSNSIYMCIYIYIYVYIYIYRVSQEECARLRESVPYVKVYRYNPEHLYPKLNGYGDNGQRSLKLWQLLHTYWLPNTY